MSMRPDPARPDKPGAEPPFGDRSAGSGRDAARPRRVRRPEQRPGPPTLPYIEMGPQVEIGRGSAYAEAEDDAPSVVRPYAWTGGRTTSRYRLEIETLLSTADHYHTADDAVSSEYHAVAGLCYQPRSVAEVAALLRMPLGVAKVLAGDMAAMGLLVVHQTASLDGDHPDLNLMERILSGLRRL